MKRPSQSKAVTLLRGLGLLLGMLPTIAGANAQDLPQPERPAAEPPARLVDEPTLRLLRSMRDLANPVRSIRWTGSVVTARGEPVAGADVWFLPDGETLQTLGQHPSERVESFGLSFPAPDYFDELPLRELSHTQTDSAGRFALHGPWRYQRADGDAKRLGLSEPLIAIAKEGQATLVARASSGRASDEWLPDVVAVGEKRLVDGVSLYGRVVDEGGQPVEAAQVRVERMEPVETLRGIAGFGPEALVAGLHDTTTDGDGNFELDGLFPGQVMLLISHADRGSVESPWVGTQAGRAEIVLPKGATISGVVCDADGRPIGGALVRAAELDRGAFGLGCIGRLFVEDDDPILVRMAPRDDEVGLTASTDASGGFVISGQWGGPVILFAEAPGFEPARLTQVQLGTVGLRVPMQPSATIALHFIDAESGLPVQADHVRAYRRGRSEDRHGADWDAETAFELPVSADGVQDQRHWVIDRVGGLGTFLFVTAPGHAPSTCKLQGLETGKHLELTLPLPRALRCEGRVVDVRGQPVAGACVDLTEPGQHFAGVEDGTLTDADGRFAFDSLAEGEWDLVVKAPDWIETVVEHVAASEAPVLVSLHRGGTIRGTVDPVAHARAGRPEVALDAQPAGQADARGYGRFARPYVRPDEHGVFEFRGVAPGVHRLTLGERSVEVAVVAGQTVEVALDKPAAR